MPVVPGQISLPTDFAVGPDGALFVADADYSCVRQILPDGGMTTIAGVCSVTRVFEPHGDGGPAVEAHLNDPLGLEVADGLLCIADSGNHVIRAVRL